MHLKIHGHYQVHWDAVCRQTSIYGTSLGSKNIIFYGTLTLSTQFNRRVKNKNLPLKSNEFVCHTSRFVFISFFIRNLSYYDQILIL